MIAIGAYLTVPTALAGLEAGNYKDMDAGNESCITIVKNANAQKLSATDPNVIKCKQQAAKSICDRASQKLDMSSINNSGANNGQKVISNCEGQQFADAVCVDTPMMDGAGMLQGTWKSVCVHTGEGHYDFATCKANCKPPGT